MAIMTIVDQCNIHKKGKPVHFSTCGGRGVWTACGLEVNEQFQVIVPGISSPEKKVTCKRCIKEMRKRIT